MACLYQKLKQIEVTSLMKLQSHLKFEYFINISHLQIIFRFAPELISVASLFQLTSWLVASLLAAESHSNERSPFFFFLVETPFATPSPTRRPHSIYCILS